MVNSSTAEAELIVPSYQEIVEGQVEECWKEEFPNPEALAVLPEISLEDELIGMLGRCGIIQTDSASCVRTDPRRRNSATKRWTPYATPRSKDVASEKVPPRDDVAKDITTPEGLKNWARICRSKQGVKISPLDADSLL